MKIRGLLILGLLPLPAIAGNERYTREIQNLLKVSDQLAENLEINMEEVELDEQGKRTMDELERWAKENPEEFRRRYPDPEGYTKRPALPPPYCPDLPDPAPGPEPEPLPPGTGPDLEDPPDGVCRPVQGKIFKGCCLMYVRMKLGLPSLARHAKDAGPALEKAGYCNYMGSYSAHNAPAGSVLLYIGGDSGHIELKTGPSSYYFGPTNGMPATDWVHIRRTLTGIYLKCDR